jgi:two-component system, LuxR family, sensor kinase FixL
MVYERDMGTNELWWSQDGLKRLGYGHEGDLSDFDALAERIHPDDRARAASARDVPLARGEPLWETEFRLRRPNGTYTHVHEQGFIVRDGADDATHMIGTLEDISQRVDIEERARQLSLDSQRTAMAEFAAIVSHEINQPMSSILTNVEAGQILLEARPPRTAELGEVLEAIREDNLRASEVVRHIRHFANKGEVAHERFDMNELVRSVARLSLNAARRRGADIWLDAGKIPAVRGDIVHMQQVLLNLITNALDAMAQSPAHARLVEVKTRVAEGDMVEVAVRDRGPGIPPANLPRLFESFFTTKADGMGLGLSIARSLVLAHGGEIRAENNRDGGATFRFTIPADVLPAAS